MLRKELNKREKKEKFKRLLSGQGEYCEATHQVSLIFENGDTSTIEVFTKRAISREEFPDLGEEIKKAMNESGLLIKIKTAIVHN